MTMIKCHECGKEISSEAKACPHCGAKPKSGIGCGPMLGIVLIAGIAWLALSPNGPSTPPHEKTQAEKDSDVRFSVGATAAKALKQSLREPDSLDIISIRTDDPATTICIEYRARNGFGGMNIDHLVVLPNRSSDEASDWNAYCTGSMHDVTAVKHLI